MNSDLVPIRTVDARPGWIPTIQPSDFLTFLVERAAARPPLPHFLTMKQARDYMGLSEACLRRMITAGKLMAIRDGRLKVRRKDLDALALSENVADWYTRDPEPMPPETAPADAAPTPAESEPDQSRGTAQG